MYGARVMQHFVNRDRKRVFVAQHGLGERVADQDDVDRGVIHQACSSVVVGGQTSNGLMLEFLFAKRSNSDFLARFANRCETHMSSSAPPASPDRACLVLGVL